MLHQHLFVLFLPLHPEFLKHFNLVCAILSLNYKQNSQFSKSNDNNIWQTLWGVRILEYIDCQMCFGS